MCAYFEMFFFSLSYICSVRYFQQINNNVTDANYTPAIYNIESIELNYNE